MKNFVLTVAITVTLATAAIAQEPSCDVTAAPEVCACCNSSAGVLEAVVSPVVQTVDAVGWLAKDSLVQTDLAARSMVLGARERVLTYRLNRLAAEGTRLEARAASLKTSSAGGCCADSAPTAYLSTGVSDRLQNHHARYERVAARLHEVREELAQVERMRGSPAARSVEAPLPPSPPRPTRAGN